MGVLNLAHELLHRFHLTLIWIIADLGETSIKSAPSIWVGTAQCPFEAGVKALAWMVWDTFDLYKKKCLAKSAPECQFNRGQKLFGNCWGLFFYKGASLFPPVFFGIC